jgi:phage tail-like protein
MAASHGQLIVLLEEQTIHRLPLTVNSVLRIGRVPESGLQLSHTMVSRNHAELRMEPQGPILTDLGSTHGTVVKGQRLLPNEPHMLADGSTFLIGPYTLIYQATEPATHSLDQDDGQLLKPEQSARPNATALLQVPLPLLHVPEATMPVPRTLEDDPDSIYLYNLPDTFQENNFLRRFLLIFEDIWEPLEQRQDHISMYFDPRTCPESFLPWLASWLGLVLPTHRLAVHRHFLTQATELYNWRGTRYGLTRMLEVCTGLTPEILDIPTRPFVILVRITIPPDFPGEIPDNHLIEALIQTHKPAHVGYLLEVNR